MVGGPKSIFAVAEDLLVELGLAVAGCAGIAIGIVKRDWHYGVGGIVGAFVLFAMLAARFFAGEVGWVSEGNAAIDTVSTWRAITPVHFLADLGWLSVVLYMWHRASGDPGWIGFAVPLAAVILPLLVVRLVVLIRWARGHRPKPDLTVSFYSPRSLLLAAAMLAGSLVLTGAAYLRFPAGFQGKETPAWANKPFIWVMWNGERHRAALLDQKGDQIKVHYLSYDSSSDEWIPRSRIVK